MASYKKLEKLIEEVPHKKPFCIVEHDYPDPDTVAGAFFFDKILRKKGFENVNVVFGGEIDNQNNEFYKNLGIYSNIDTDIDRKNMFHLNYEKENLEHLITDDAKFIFVDHNGKNSLWGRDKIPHNNIFTIIDHHEKPESLPGEYIDCREVGSTSSILTEYLKNGAKKNLDKDSLKKLCTLMYMAILIDTNHLRDGATDTDLTNINYISSYVDYKAIGSFYSCKREHEWMSAYGKAYYTRQNISEGVNLASIGKLQGECTRGVLPNAANDLLKEKEIDTIYVLGFDPSYIDISIRTEKPSLDYQQIVSSFPGAIGGGRNGAGKIQVPTDYICSEYSNGKISPEEAEKQIMDEARNYLQSYHKS